MPVSPAERPATAPGDTPDAIEFVLDLECEVFSTPTAIIMSFGDPTHLRTRLLRVEGSELDMNKLEQAIETGTLEARREDAYYVAHLARQGLVPGVSAERAAALIAAGGALEVPDPEDDVEGPHKGVDPGDPSPGVLACGHDPDNDPCVHRDADPDDPELRR